MDSQFTNCNCEIENILKRGFGSLEFSGKKRIIETGRPMNELKELKVQTKACVRKFNHEQYAKTQWLCGCRDIGKLFCWPCLLFNHEKNVWNGTGYSDINNLHKALKRHEISQSHIVSTIQLATFGKSRIDFQLDNQNRLSVLKYNEKVKENREVLKRLIDIVCHIGKRELALRGHNESDSSVDRGNYVELVHLLKKYDHTLNSHLQDSTVFTGLSNRIQNDLIESVSNIIMKEIKEEVRNTPFVAVIVDETTDVRSKSQLSTVLRYTTCDGGIQERFLGFTDVSADRTAAALAKHVIDCINQYDFGSKIVAQTYDGAAVMSGDINGLQAKVKDVFPDALFIHCMAHKLNLVLSQSVSCIKECNIFFKTLSGFSSFFSKSSKRAYYLDQQVKKRFPKVTPTRWNYNSRLVETVYEYKSELIAMFENIIEHPDDWDNDTFIAARGFLFVLKDFTFNFLLNVFKNIFSITGVLFDVLQTKSNDISFCIRKLTDAKENIANKREDFQEIFSKASDIETTEPLSKRLRVDNVGDVSTSFRKLYNEILDNIVGQIEVRFQNFEKLQFLELITPSREDRYGKAFPENAFSSLKMAYGQHFDFPRLRSELLVCYSKEDFKNKSANELLTYLKETQIDSALYELTKLCNLIATIPASSASVERSFSALKRIKTYARNAQKEERMSKLALLSIEKKLLENIRRNQNFYDQVIDDFAAKERRIELVYKKT